MADPSRTKKGQFAKGASGNPRGRPRKQPRLLHAMPYRNRKAIFEIAEIQLPMNLGGERKELSAYAANMLAMAIKGASGNTAAARIFLEQVNLAAATNGEQNEFGRWAAGQLMDARVRLEELEAQAAPRHGVYVVPRHTLETVGPSASTAEAE